MTYSIVIPAYNVENYIERTLESAIMQTRPAEEIILVDDGSKDKTAQVIQLTIQQFIKKNPSTKTNIKYFYQDNSGAAVARNRGVQEACGDWILFLDGDDLFLPERVEKLDNFLQTTDKKNVVMVAANEFEGNDEQGWLYKDLSAYYDQKNALFPQLFRSCFLSTSSMSVLRSAFLDSNGMDPQLRSAQDYDLWLKLALLGELGFINEPLSKYTLRPGNISSNPASRYKCLLIILQKNKHLVPLTHTIRRYLLIHYEVFRISISLKKYIFASQVLIMAIFNLKKIM